MAETNLDYSQIKQKAIHGAISLTFRRVILLAITLVVINFLLPRYLPPSIIGTFNLATAIVGFFSFFSDIGLAASIIQKKEEITEDELASTFFIQQTLVTIIALVIFIAAPFIANFYKLDPGGDYLIRALAVSFFLTSFKVIPSVLFERDLNFKPLVIVEILENVIFVGLLVPLVLMDYGLFSYAIAQVVRSIVGVVVMYNITPWRIRFKRSFSSVKQLLRFGIPYQTNALLALLKDRLVVLLIGAMPMITKSDMGFITLAQSWAFIPLEIMNIIIRVTFPAYAKLQDDRQALGAAVERSLYVMGLFLYPAMFGILALATNLVEIIGKDKWGAIIPLVYLYSFSTLWASISTTFTNVFNAVGEIKITLKLMIMWTLLTWALTPVLVWQFDYLGVGIASAIISFSSIVTIYLMRQIAKINLLHSIGKPLLAAFIMGIILLPLARILLTSKIAVLPLILLGGLIYGLIMIAIDRKRIIFEMKEIFAAIR